LILSALISTCRCRRRRITERASQAMLAELAGVTIEDVARKIGARERRGQ
jgi:DNA-binding IscR family transcriptional regulator